MSLSLLLSLHCIKDKWAVNSVCACVHASVHLCVSDRGLDSPVFVVFVVLRAPGGCAHFKGPSELWGLETWDCAAQLAPGHGFTRRMWAEQGELGWDGLPQTSAPFLKTAISSERLGSRLSEGNSTFLWLLIGVWFTSKSTILVTVAVFSSHFRCTFKISRICHYSVATLPEFPNRETDQSYHQELV